MSTRKLEEATAEPLPTKSKAAKTTSENNNNNNNNNNSKTKFDMMGQLREMDPYPSTLDLLNLTDAVLMNILQFLGPGHYIFVALICRRFNELYGEYFSTLQKEEIPMTNLRGTRRSQRNYTFYSAAFSSVSCANFWDQDTKGKVRRLYGRFVCQTVAKYGNVEVLKWAHQQKGFPLDCSTSANAAGGGRLKLLQWVRANGFPWNKYTCSYAAEFGQLAVLKWARENGCPWDSQTCSYAAGGGHFKLLQWARENGCHWDKFTCSSAARGGHLPVLKWARDNGCPWDWSTLHYAEAYGHREIVEWARANGCPERPF